MSLLPFGRNNLRQSNLPAKAKSASQLLVRQKHSKLARSAQEQASPLTFSQALIITAGMAGLVGLLSGVLIRFSLANSSSARFLSPLQTFPELSDWSSETAPDEVDTNTAYTEPDSSELWRSPDELDWETDTQDFDAFSSESFTDSRSTTEIRLEDRAAENSVPFLEIEGTQADSAIETNAQDFDAFADRGVGQRKVDAVDPLKALSRGPLLRKPATETVAPDSALESRGFEDNALNAQSESTDQEAMRDSERDGKAYGTISGGEPYFLDNAEAERSPRDDDEVYYEPEGYGPESW